MSNFIKVSQDDSTKHNVDLKNIKPISKIKVIRPEEPDYSSSESESGSSLSSEPSTVYKKKTKKVLRKKEKSYQEPETRNKNYSAFSNPKKINQHDSDSDESSVYSSEESSTYNESEAGEETDIFEEKQKLKQDLLIKIQVLEKKGFEFSKKFTMTSNYEEMDFEYNKIKSFIETQAGVKFARRCLMACVTGIEFLNKKFDPFNIKLEGWSENVMESVDDYDNIFEKLHEKYSSKAEVSPEIELLLMLGGSAFMFHLTNSLLKGPMMSNPIIAQNNPNFIASMMGAMNQGMKEVNKPPNFKQQQFPQQQNVPQFPQPMETRGIRKEMRGPNIDLNLFNGTPLANNYPQPPPPSPIYTDQRRLYEENLMDDDDRVSVGSSDSSVSSISIGSTKVFTQKKGKMNKNNKGLELNIK